MVVSEAMANALEMSAPVPGLIESARAGLAELDLCSSPFCSK
jgi:hypothetical protein